MRSLGVGSGRGARGEGLHDRKKGLTVFRTAGKGPHTAPLSSSGGGPGRLVLAMLRRAEACDAPEMWPPLPGERRTDGRPRMSREDVGQPWEDGEVEFKVQVWSDEDLSPTCADRGGTCAEDAELVP